MAVPAIVRAWTVLGATPPTRTSIGLRVEVRHCTSPPMLRVECASGTPIDGQAELTRWHGTGERVQEHPVEGGTVAVDDAHARTDRSGDAGRKRILAIRGTGDREQENRGRRTEHRTRFARAGNQSPPGGKPRRVRVRVEPLCLLLCAGVGCGNELQDISSTSIGNPTTGFDDGNDDECGDGVCCSDLPGDGNRFRCSTSGPSVSTDGSGSGSGTDTGSGTDAADSDSGGEEPVCGVSVLVDGGFRAGLAASRLDRGDLAARCADLRRHV